MHHDRLDATRTAPDRLHATCSCGWWCAGPTAESLGDQWDAHRVAVAA